MKKSKSKVVEILTDKLYNDFVKSEDQLFFDVVFSQNPTQQALDKLLQVWDIEVKGGCQALLLSYLMKEHPELEFSKYVAPRLKGLIDFHRCKNVSLLSQFSKLGKKLNEEGIVPVLFKGAAMRALRPELARPMGDVDFLVRPQEFEKTVKIAEKCGFYYACAPADHAADMITRDKVGAIDIHTFFKLDDMARKNISKKSAADWKKLNDRFYERTQKAKAFGVDVLLPSNEDLFFIVLANLNRNITARSSVKNILFALFDLKFLLEKPDFNWDIVFENIKISNGAAKIRIAVEFVERIVLGFLPEILREELPLEGEVKDYYERVFYDQYHYLGVREKCHELLWADALKKLQLLKYATMRVQYSLMRFIRKRPALVHLYLRGYSNEYGL